MLQLLDQPSGLAQILDPRYFSLSGTLQVKECVAWAAARTACPNDPRPSIDQTSALACSLEMRLVRSLWENTFSCASEAFLFKSYVLCHAFRASTPSSRRPRRFRTPPPKYPGPVLSSGSCRTPYRSLLRFFCRWH